MKKTTRNFILCIVALFSFSLSFVQAQSDACSATCLPSSGFVSGNNGTSGFLPMTPCGGGSVEVYNLKYYTFYASGTSFSASASVTGCSVGATLAFTLYGGDDCGNISPISCLNCATGGTISAATVPCKQYWIGVSGCASSVCNFTLTYSGSSLLTTAPVATLTGPTTACKGTTQEYSASTLGVCGQGGYTWTTQPAGTAQITNNNDGTASIKWLNTGIIKLCVKPKFNLKCNPTTIPTTCLDVNVTTLNPATTNLNLCCEQVPYNLTLLPLIQAANPNVSGLPDPADFTIANACGSTKTTTVNYAMPDGCSGKVTVNATIKEKGVKNLAPILICEGDFVTIANQILGCANASAGTQTILVKANANQPNACDTTYNFNLQCIKINPIVTPANATLDCVNQNVTIKAGNSIFLPTSNTANPSVKSYLWSTGATTSDITVNKGGTYTVTITYQYTFTNAFGTVTKTCSKVATRYINTSFVEPPEPPIIMASNQTAKFGDTVNYTIDMPSIGLTYNWIVTGGVASNLSGTQISVIWGQSPPMKICAVASYYCGIYIQNSIPKCINITPPLVPSSITLAGNKKVCVKDTVTYQIVETIPASVTYTWILPQEATLLDKNGSKITVLWIKDKVKAPISVTVKDVADNSVSTTIDVEANALPAKPSIGKILYFLKTNATSNIQWFLDKKPIVGETKQTLIIKKTGTYFVKVTNGNACSEVSKSLFVVYKPILIKTQATQENTFVENPIEEIRSESEKPFLLYPNPTTQFLTIQLPLSLQIRQLEILDILGKSIKTEKIGTNQETVEVDVSTCLSGSYIVLFKNEKGEKVEVKSFLKM